MIKWLFLLIIIVFLLYMAKEKIHIKWKTFLKKGFAPERGKFGVYCYCGKQGKGKTYGIMEYLWENRDKKIFCNIKNIKGIDYTYFNGFDELLKLRNEKDCIIVFDEIFTALTRSSKINTDVLDFLSQMRKRRIIFLTSAQEWLEINITLRRYCRYQIECNMINFLGIGIQIKRFYNAELMKWSQIDNEYIAPIQETTIAHTRKIIGNMYDTNEQIEERAVSPSRE